MSAIPTIATVTAAAASEALTTLERVKAELDLTGGAHDELLTRKIAEASAGVEAHLGRTLRRESLSQIFWGAHDCVEALVLDRDPVVSIDSITLDDDAVAETDYRLDAESGLLYRLSDGYAHSWAWCKSVVVAYTAGYLLPGENGRNLPAAIEGAVVKLVSSFWLSRGRDPLTKAEDIPGVLRTEYWVGATGAAGELPPAVVADLAPFRRPVIA